ncbi:MAG: hypothetical protein ACE5G6_01190 [Terriglobia bacterium]
MKLLKGTSAMIVAVGLYLGFAGIHGEETTRAGNCSATYEKYYLDPILSDIVFMTLPSPDSIRAAGVRNAKVRVLRCLCEDREANKELIADYYASHEDLRRGHPPDYPMWMASALVGEEVDSMTHPAATEFICTQEAIPTWLR